MSTQKQDVIFIHMFNNFSGSPNVLSTITEEFYKKNIHTTIVTSFNNKGFLSDIPCSKKINVSYKFHQNLILRAFELIRFQLLSAWIILKSSKNSIVYINTILPFLSALAAKINGNKIIYHIHEAYPKKSVFNTICFWFAENYSDKIICVSEYVKNNLSIKAQKKAYTVYNSLSKSFIDNIKEKTRTNNKNILMISSARIYKGIFEFCELAKILPLYKFTLVCDATVEEIDRLFENTEKTPNLKIFPSQKGLHEFYAHADLILNLSNPLLIIETFGLTILEGMYYGIPAITPNVGGIAEIIEEGKNGKKINVNNLQDVKQGIIDILSNEDQYDQMSLNATEKSKIYNVDYQVKSIFNLIF